MSVSNFSKLLTFLSTPSTSFKRRLFCFLRSSTPFCTTFFDLLPPDIKSLTASYNPVKNPPTLSNCNFTFSTAESTFALICGKLFNAAPIRRMEAKFKTLDMISEGPLMIDCFILFADFDIGDENEEILLVLLILSLSSFFILFLLSDNDLN